MHGASYLPKIHYNLGTITILSPPIKFTSFWSSNRTCSVQCSSSLHISCYCKDLSAGKRKHSWLLFKYHAGLMLQQTSMQSAPRIDHYSVVIKDATGTEALGPLSYPGNSSSLSANISSLPQCMSYTVSVTASNTGGRTTAEAELSEFANISA